MSFQKNISSVSRRDFIKATGVSAAGVASIACRTSHAKSLQKKPNIIFIFSDDWGYGDLSCHGSDFVKTPNLDQLAKEGIDFQQFTVNNPVCSPSRTSVMTGQFPARHSVHRHFATIAHHQKTGMPDWLDPAAPMLPKMMKEGGYVTGHFGKWHLTNRAVSDAPLPPAYGYDEYGAFNLPGEQIMTAETCPLAVDFINRHKDQPFFINVWLHETHLPHYPQDSFMKQFAHLDEQKQVYAAVVAEADAGVGAIMAALKKHGIDDNTLVIFSSDNGPEWTGNSTNKKKGDNSTGDGLGNYYSVGTTGGLKGEKRSLFAGGVRVPFLVRWPGVVPSGKVDKKSVITAVDLLPTFMEITGQALPKSYQPDGESVLSTLKGKPFKRSKPIFWEWNGSRSREDFWPHLGIRDGKWKLMINQKRERSELYDIEADWSEKKNLSAQFPDVTKKLTDKVLAWKKTLPLSPPSHCFSTLRKE